MTQADFAYSTNPWTPQSPAAELCLCNVRIVDPASGSTSDPTNILIKNGKVDTISSDQTQSATPQIDLKGKFLCPGLIDCHVHVTATPGASSLKDTFDDHPDSLAFRTAWTCKQMLYRGFTSARDCGGADYAVRDAIASGLIPGPRLFVAGKALSQTGGHGDFRRAHQGNEFKCCSGSESGLGRVCDGVPQCLEAARDELRKGADFLKIMVGGGIASPADPLEMIQFTPEEIQAITQSARNLGKYVTAHAYTNEAIRHAVDNGVLGIEHANFIDEKTARYCAEKGVYVTPTLATLKAIVSPPYDKFIPESGIEKAKAVNASGLAALKILHDAGVTICLGTDLLSGMHARQNQEFEIRAEALSAADILRSATTNAARLVGMEDRLGTLTAGAIADFILLDQNPLDNITILRKFEQHGLAIAKEGRIVMSRLEAEGLMVDSLYK